RAGVVRPADEGAGTLHGDGDVLLHPGAPRSAPPPHEPPSAHRGVRRFLCGDDEEILLVKEALDLSWITSQLAVGGRFPIERAGELPRDLGIARVVDLRAECCNDEAVLRRNGVELLKLPTEDRCAVSQTMLDEGVAWAREQLRAGHKTFIHCEYGIGRSALLALCVL